MGEVGAALRAMTLAREVGRATLESIADHWLLGRTVRVNGYLGQVDRVSQPRSGGPLLVRVKQASGHVVWGDYPNNVVEDGEK